MSTPVKPSPYPSPPKFSLCLSFLYVVRTLVRSALLSWQGCVYSWPGGRGTCTQLWPLLGTHAPTRPSRAGARRGGWWHPGWGYSLASSSWSPFSGSEELAAAQACDGYQPAQLTAYLPPAGEPWPCGARSRDVAVQVKQHRLWLRTGLCRAGNLVA